MDEVKEGWVFVDMPGEASPVLAARLVIDGGVGRFVYGKTYLARNDAFPLDPINLPLELWSIVVFSDLIKQRPD